MTVYPRILMEFTNTPLAIMPEKLEIVAGFMNDQLQGVKYDEAAIQAVTSSRQAGSVEGSATALIPIYGTISHRMNLVKRVSGGTSTQMAAAALREAVQDHRVSDIVLEIDSPGGAVSGVAELAVEISTIAKAGNKKVIAHVNSLAASAAYWLASQANEIVVTPSGEVGSIGVYMVHRDHSGKEKSEGVKSTIISAGEYKAEMNSLTPLSEGAREYQQSRVDEVYQAFTEAVAEGRSHATGRQITGEMVRSDFGRGRVVGAQKGLGLGMVDRIETLEQTLSRIASDRKPDMAAKRRARALAMVAI